VIRADDLCAWSAIPPRAHHVLLRAFLGEAQEKRGYVLGTVGRLDESITLLKQAADSYRALDDQESEARVVAELGLQQFFHGTADASIDRIREMLSVLHGTRPPETLVKLYLGEDLYYWSKLRHADALASGERGLEAARRMNDPRLLAMSLAAVAAPTAAMGHPEEAIRLLQEAVTVTEASGDVLWAMHAAQALGETYWNAGELVLAPPQFERAFALAQRLENDSQMAYARSSVAYTQFHQGRWAEAEREYRRALDLVPRAGASWGARWTLTTFGFVCVAAGQWEEAEHVLIEALALTEQSDDLQWRYGVLAGWAELALLRGQPERALTWLEPMHQHPEAYPSAEIEWTVVGWALLELGRVDEAAAIVHVGLHSTDGSMHRVFVPA
jgi:tetratricopeptide (TPR) repeat protein